MIPSHFPQMLRAELQLLFSRRSAQAVLAVSLLVGVLAVALALGVDHIKDSATVNNRSVAQMFQPSGVSIAGWALSARNFFLLPALLLLCTAASVAGDLSDRTLREVLVRPVSRESVLAVKLLSLLILDAASLLLTLLPALAGGLLVFGMPEGSPSLVGMLTGYAVSGVADLGLIALGALIAALAPSTGGVVVGVILVRMVDMGLAAALKLLGGFLQIEWAPLAQRFTLDNAFGAWEGWKDGWEWERLAPLAVINLLLIGLAMVRFRRMDVQ